MSDCEFEELCNMVYSGLETYVDCPLSDDPGDCDWLCRIDAIIKKFREDLVEDFIKHEILPTYWNDRAIAIIRTHGLEATD